jgi:hypothetical protein
MPLPCLLIEGSPAGRALHISRCLFQSLLSLFVLVLLCSCHGALISLLLEHAPKGSAFGLPLGHLGILHLLDFFVGLYPLLHEFDLFLSNDPLSLGIELLPLLLENLLAVGFVLGDALWVELSAAPLRAFYELGF